MQDKRPTLSGPEGLCTAVIRKAVKDYQYMKKRGLKKHRMRGYTVYMDTLEEFLFGENSFSASALNFYAPNIHHTIFEEKAQKEEVKDD